jgi:hypothetical protein
MKLCCVPDCGRPFEARDRCQTHYQRLVRGIANPDGPIKPRVADGAGAITAEGYRIRTADGRRIMEHRLVMEQVLGRRLLPGENVHHINGVRADNRPENLELWVTAQPSGQRVEDLVAWAEEVLRRYGRG